MKIAFDGTVLHGRKSGVGYYCEELFKAMVAMDHQTEFFVFSHQPLRLNLPAANGNVRFSDSKFFPVRAVYLHGLLPQLLENEKPDLCHYTNFLAPIADSTPYIVTIHDMGLESLRSAHPLAKRLYTRRLVPRIAERARLIITNSEFSKWEIVRYLGIPSDRIRVTPLAASSDFSPVHEAERAAVLGAHQLTSPYLLYVGNLEPRKNLVRLLEAFAAMNNRDHELAIVGNPWYRGSDAAQAAKSLGIANRVRFLGYVPRSDLPALYGGATAFVYPSLLEGFGLPVVEAMACGTPVVTSDNSSLKEIAADAAMLVDPMDVRSIQQALSDVIEDGNLRTTLALRGLNRARQFSWKDTAALTLAAYEEATGHNAVGHDAVRHGSPGALAPGTPSLTVAVLRTVDYAAMFQYPLRLGELQERLFDVKADISAVERCCAQLSLPRIGDFVSVDSDFVSIRHFREIVTDRAIKAVENPLRTLAGMPFIRMIAFSGATAHRNMTNTEDVDLFMVVEDGKLWATFLIAMVWSKIKGLRQRLCMNYVVSDRALPLFEHDAFTAQQVTSLKPIFGKPIYDEFLAANPFVRERFPNFNPIVHRSLYPEMQPGAFKRVAEAFLRCGPIQVFERISRWILGAYLRKKANAAAASGSVDVLLEPRRLKLHMHSHKQQALAQHCIEPQTAARA